MAVQIEIGVARPDELDRILEVMCEAFEMPYHAARAIYYADPYLDVENKFVMRVNGEVVSCLTIVETVCWIGQTTVKMGGIAGVATCIAARRKGYAARLLEDTLHALAERGYALASLFPFARDYYRRLGWETCSRIWQCSVAKGATPVPIDVLPVRPAVSADIPGLQALYDARSYGRSLHCLRDMKRWQTILDHTHTAIVCATNSGDIDGYLLHDYRRGTASIMADSGAPPALRILEMCTQTEDARRSFTAYLGSRSDVGAIEYGATWLDLEESMLLNTVAVDDNGTLGVRIDCLSGVMARVLDFASLLIQLKSNWKWFEGQLAIMVEDPILNSASRQVIITGDGSGEPTIEIQSEFWGPISAIDRIRGDVRVWSQVVTGYLSGSDACARGLLQPQTPLAASWVSCLFVQRTPFLPTPDHF